MIELDEDLIPYYKCRVCGMQTCKDEACDIKGKEKVSMVKSSSKKIFF